MHFYVSNLPPRVGFQLWSAEHKADYLAHTNTFSFSVIFGISSISQLLLILVMSYSLAIDEIFPVSFGDVTPQWGDIETERYICQPVSEPYV